MRVNVKQFLPRSLFYRSLLILTVPIILTLSISTYVFFDRHWERMAGRLATGVAGEIAFITSYLDEGVDEERLDFLSVNSLNHMQLNIKYVPEAIIKREEREYFWRGDIIRDLLKTELKERLKKPFRIVVDTDEKWIQAHVQLDEGLLIITSPERRLFSSSGYVFLVWMIGVSSVLMAVAILFMRNQIRPIKKLAIAAERFGKGRDVPFFKPEGAREVRQAARAFIGMRDRMEKQIQQRTLMLAGVSHDLRTPLTRMKLQAEMIDDAEEREALKSDIAEMERMINAYLEFTKGEGNEKATRIDLEAIISHSLSGFEKMGMTTTLEVNLSNPELYLRPVAFERCLNNIFSNAQKFADKLLVRVEEKEENVVLHIEDNGVGIDPHFYEDVFKPFYREEKSRNAKTGGVGLGLPIAQDIILAHGGKIELSRSQNLGGLEVIITLPV